MIGSNFSRPLALLALLDCLILLGCYIAARAILGGASISAPSPDLGRLLFVCAVVAGMIFAMGLYSWHAVTGYIDMFVRLVAALFLAYVIYGAAAYLFSFLRLPEASVTLAFAFAMPLAFVVRMGFGRLTRLAQFKSRILVLGTGERAARIAGLERRGTESRFVVVAFVKMESGAFKVDADRIVEPDDLAEFATTMPIDEVVVAMEERRGQLPLQPLIRMRLQGIAVRDYQGFMERAQGRIDVDTLHPSWFLANEGFRSSKLHRFAKRVFDISVAAMMLGFTLPLFVATALAIRLESRGPVFYHQVRVGRAGVPFTLIKFRSMKCDAENRDTPQWAIANDPRVTRVGAFIRKTRIDELPQVINVLKGEMSFVGPRPERPQFVEMLAKEIPFYHERHSVRPGITGWAQLNYPYGASVEDAKQKLQYDLFYVKYFTIVFDFLIVLQTVRVVLWAEGAR